MKNVTSVFRTEQLTNVNVPQLRCAPPCILNAPSTSMYPMPLYKLNDYQVFEIYEKSPDVQQ